MSYGLCDECGADIVWAMTLPGRRRMPIDPERYDLDDTRANLVTFSDHLGSLIVRAATDETLGMLPKARAMPHFATCRARTQRRAAAQAESLRRTGDDGGRP